MTPEKPPPIVWLLLGDKIGDNAQALALEKRLGVTTVHKRLQYRAAKLPNPLKGISRTTLAPTSSDLLQPPWPDLVIATGRRSVPIARWIRKQSGGVTKLVQIGRPRAASSMFDLVLTTPQYRMDPASNVLELPVPFTPLTRDQLDTEATQLTTIWQDLPGPRIAVLVGGESSTSHISPVAGERLGEQASQLAEAMGGSLMVLSGRRTLPETMTSLSQAITCPFHQHPWKSGDAKNPYVGVLGMADAVIVTTDSASMLADALITEKPVMTFEVPTQPRRSTDRLTDKLSQSERSPVRSLAHHGWVSLPRQMDLLVEGLVTRGLVRSLNNVLETGEGLPQASPMSELESLWQNAVDQISCLLD